MRTAQAHLAVSLQYPSTFNLIDISARLPCSSNLKNVFGVEQSFKKQKLIKTFNRSNNSNVADSRLSLHFFL